MVGVPNSTTQLPGTDFSSQCLHQEEVATQVHHLGIQAKAIFEFDMAGQASIWIIDINRPAAVNFDAFLPASRGFLCFSGWSRLRGTCLLLW